MSLYYLKVNENEVLSTKVTYEDVVWLIQEYINKNNKVPSYNDFRISNNLPAGHTLKKILEDRNISYVDFWTQFGLNSRKYVSNLIPNKSPWMIDYIEGGYEIAKNILVNDNHKIKFCCPNCNSKTMRSPNYVNKYGFNCPVCSDGISYPNKFSYELLRQLKQEYQITNIQHEFSPSWAKRYRYDNYFEYNNKGYIIEMDGGFHKNNIYTISQYTLKERQQADIIKNKLAHNYNINIIRIDCDPSTYETISSNIKKSELANLFDLNIIDFEKCNIYAMKNIVREICNDYNATNKTVTELSNIYRLATTTIRRYLNNGTKLNWCKYDSELSKRNYQTEEYGQKIIAENIITHDKINFDSISSASQKSIESCGVAMSNSSIRRHIKNKTSYKGYMFYKCSWERR